MTITFTGAGTATAASGASPQAVTTAAALAVGDILVVLMAYDNSGTSGADPMTATISVAPATGAVGASVSAQTGLNDPGAASAGLAVRCVAFPVTTAIPSGTVCNVSWSGTVVVRSVVFGKVSSTKTLTYRTNSGATAANVVGATTGTLVTPSVTNTEMVLCWAGHENGAAITADADATNGSWSAVYGAFSGSGATGMAAYFQNKIVTATATQSFDPTGTSSDWIVGCLIFQEGVVALAASIGGTSTTTAAVVVAHTLVGSSAGTSTAAGTLSASGGTVLPTTWSDNFNRANGTIIGTDYAAWTQYGYVPPSYTAVEVASNVTQANPDFQHVAVVRTSSEVLSNSQRVKATASDLGCTLGLFQTLTPAGEYDGLTAYMPYDGWVYWYVNGTSVRNINKASFGAFPHTFEVTYDGTTASLLVDGAVYDSFVPTAITYAGGRTHQGFGFQNTHATIDNVDGGLIGGGAPPVYSDNFNRANSTPVPASGVGLGSAWQGSNWQIDTNQARRDNTAGDYIVFLQDLGTPDHWVECDVVVNGGYGVINCRRPSTADSFGLGNGYLFFMFPADDTVVLGTSVAGNYNQIIGGVSTGHGNTGKLRIEAQGTNIRCYYNGTKVIDLTDSTITTGNFVGLNSGQNNGSPGAGPMYDNFRCGALPYTPGPGPVALAGSSAGTSGNTATLTTPGGVVTYADNFNRANGALGSPWVAFDGGLVVSGNKCIAPDGGLHTSRYNQTFAVDQWVEADVVWVPGASVDTPALRFTAGGDFYYYWLDGSNHVQINKRVSGSYSNVGTGTATIPAGTFRARMEAQGTTLRAYINDVLVLTGTDSSIATGQPGVLAANGTGGTLDNWRGGNLPYVPLTPYVVATTYTQVAPTSVDVAKPADGMTGDYYVIYYNTGDWGTSPPVVTFPGFTAAPGGVVGIPDQQGQWFWKAYDGTEPSSFANTGGNSSHWTGYLCFLVRGLPANWTPPIPAPVGVSGTPPIVFPAVTVPDRSLMLVGYKDWSGSGPTSSPASWTTETPLLGLTGYSQKYDTAATAGPYTIQPWPGGTRSVGQQLFTASISLPVIQNFDLAANGTNSNVVNFSPAAAGDMLLVLCSGQVTHSASVGWTKGASCVGGTETCVFYKTASAGDSTITLTHNGSNYPTVVSVVRFPGGGNYVTGGQLGTGGGNQDGPTLSGLSGSNLWVFGVQGAGRNSGDAATNANWISAPTAALTEGFDSSKPVTNGYQFSWCYAANWASSTFVANTQISIFGGSWENIAFAVRAPAAPAGLVVTDRGEFKTAQGSITMACTSAAFSPAAGSLLVLMAVNNSVNSAGLNGQDLVFTPTDNIGDTGGGAWTDRGTITAGVKNTNSYMEAVTIWTRQVGTLPGTSKTVTLTATTTNGTGTSTNGWQWASLAEVTGQNASPIGASGSNVVTSGTISGITVTLSGAPAADSAVFSVYHADDNATIPTQPAGWTMLQNESPAPGPVSAASAYINSGGSTTLTWTGPNDFKTYAVALEIKSTSGGGGSAVALAAASAGTSTASATAMVAARSLAATVAGTSAQTSALAVARPLAATVNGTSSTIPAAPLTVAHSLASTVAGTSSATATGMISTIGLSATVAGTSTATGAVAVAKALAGSAAGTSTVTSDLTRTSATGIFGNSTGVGTASGTLSVAVAQALIGSSAGVGTASAALALALPLVATVPGVSTASGTMVAVARPLAGSAAGTSSASGTLITTSGLQLVATVAGTSTASGSLSIVLSTAVGSAAGTSTASADLAVARPLASTVAGVSTVTADLTVAHTLASTVAGISTAAGNLIVAHTLVATVAGTSTASAGLVVSGAGGLASYVVGTSTAAGSLSVARPLVGSAVGSSTASGDLSRLVPLVASVAGTSTAVATGLSRIVPLAGSATGSSTVTASLRLAIALTGSADGVNTVVAAIAVAHVLTGLSNGVGTASGDLFVGRGQFLSGTANGKSTAVGALQVIFIAPVYGLWNGQAFDAMQYGDKAVTAWEMVPD